MKEQDQIIAIAELDGWEYIDTIPATSLWKDSHRRFREPVNSQIVLESRLPDYLNSRDAIVPVIEKQFNNSNSSSIVFTQILHKIVHKTFSCECQCHYSYELLLATPQQLCEALLRATNKWKD